MPAQSLLSNPMLCLLLDHSEADVIMLCRWCFPRSLERPSVHSWARSCLAPGRSSAATGAWTATTSRLYALLDSSPASELPFVSASCCAFWPCRILQVCQGVKGLLSSAAMGNGTSRMTSRPCVSRLRFPGTPVVWPSMLPTRCLCLWPCNLQAARLLGKVPELSSIGLVDIETVCPLAHCTSIRQLPYAFLGGKLLLSAAELSICSDPPHAARTKTPAWAALSAMMLSSAATRAQPMASRLHALLRVQERLVRVLDQS